MPLQHCRFTSFGHGIEDSGCCAVSGLSEIAFHLVRGQPQAANETDTNSHNAVGARGTILL